LGGFCYYCSFDSFDESMGSPPSRVILFGDIPTVISFTSVIALETYVIPHVISSATPLVETTLVASPTGLCGLVPYSDSPEYITPLPATSPLLYTNSSEASYSSGGLPSQDPYAITAASAIIVSFDSFDESMGSPPSRVILFGDIPTVISSTSVIALETYVIPHVISSATPLVETTLVASPTGLCGLVPYSDSLEYITPLPATSPLLYTNSSEASYSSGGLPSEDPYAITIAHHRPSSSSLPTDSLPVHSLDLDAPDQAHSGSSTRVVSPRLGYPSVRAPRHSEAFHRWCAAPLSTCYPPTKSESSSRDSSKRPRHSSSHCVGPSRKRCRSLADSLPSSTPVMRSLAPTHTDLLPPHKRFRDSYSSESSMEEDTEIATTETEDGRELDIVDRDDVRDRVEIDPRDVRDDIKEYEADTSARDTVEVGINPMSALVADEESE
nr:hypothetical protein [Tanacetum cinerariifolium]